MHVVFLHQIPRVARVGTLFSKAIGVLFSVSAGTIHDWSCDWSCDLLLLGVHISESHRLALHRILRGTGGTYGLHWISYWSRITPGLCLCV